MNEHMDSRLVRQGYSGEFAIRLTRLLAAIEQTVVAPVPEKDALALIDILANRELHLRTGDDAWNAGNLACALGVGDAAALVASLNNDGRDAKWWRMRFVHGERGDDTLVVQEQLVNRLLSTGLFSYIEP